MMINRRLFLGGTVSAAALAALAACAGSPSESGSGNVDLAVSDINPQDRSALQKGGELRIPILSMIPNYNPCCRNAKMQTCFYYIFLYCIISKDMKFLSMAGQLRACQWSIS